MSKVAERPYLFYELTNSLCTKCLSTVEAKIIFQEGNVYLLKNCLKHGLEKVLISTDIEYYKKCRGFLKPGQLPKRFNTKIEKGCPHDCGLCPDHEQHSCLTLIEVTDRCNLKCPICYAESSPNNGNHRSLEEIDFMLNELVKNEGEPDIVQISGGEPTIHPEFFKIIELAKTKPIRHLMVNTNGIKIAKDDSFAEKLANYKANFEVYLQFDSLDKQPIEELRGENLLDVRLKAINKLNEFNISTNLVVTLKQGLNDHEIGKIIEFAASQKCVRGVTFQPIQTAGRFENFDPAKDRLTLSEVRNKILAQTSLFTSEDIIPVPCHPDCLAMAYGLKMDGQIHPLTRYLSPEILIDGSRNTILYEQETQLKDKIFNLFSLNHNAESSSEKMAELLCCLPEITFPAELSYENMFRVIIMEFLDPWNFDVRSVKRSCVHIVHKDGRIIPFDTYNLFYR